MATVAMKPTSDGTGATLYTIHGGESFRFASINHGTGALELVDTKYIKNYYNADAGPEIAFFGFGTMPEDFDEATSATVKIRQLCETQTGNDSIKYQLYQSNELTALTNEIELECDNDEIAHVYPHTFRTDTLSFSIGGIYGAITEEAWSGARLKITHVGPGDSSDPEFHISEIQLNMVYDVAAAPEIVMTGLGGENIAAGDSSATTTDGTDFGTITAGGSTVTRTFTVTNDGDADLTTSSLSVPTGFTITEALDATISASSNDTFSVRLDNVDVGTKTGQISIDNNDADEDPYNFTITGEVSAAAASTASPQRFNIVPGGAMGTSFSLIEY